MGWLLLFSEISCLVTRPYESITVVFRDQLTGQEAVWVDYYCFQRSAIWSQDHMSWLLLFSEISCLVTRPFESITTVFREQLTGQEAVWVDYCFQRTTDWSKGRMSQLLQFLENSWLVIRPFEWITTVFREQLPYEPLTTVFRLPLLLIFVIDMVICVDTIARVMMFQMRLCQSSCSGQTVEKPASSSGVGVWCLTSTGPWDVSVGCGWVGRWVWVGVWVR